MRRPPTLRPVAMGLLLTGLALACAPPPKAASTSAPLIGAQLAGPEEYGFAVAVLATYGSNGQVFCTGVQVLPDVVLTAGHCVETFTVARNQVGPSIRFWVSSLADLSLVADGRVPSDATPVTAEVAYPEWLSTHPITSDVGVLFLGRARTRPEPWPALVPLGAEDRVVPGLPVTLVGWGVEADLASATSDTKRYAKLQLGSVTEGFVGYGGPSRYGSALACSGDSGGPILANNGDDLFVVGLSVRSDCRRFSAGTRPERFRAFWSEILAAACADGRRPDCSIEQLQERAVTRFPRAAPRTPGPELGAQIDQACAHESGHCTDGVTDPEECVLSLGAALQAVSDPACVSTATLAVSCLSCMASSCRSSCADCPAAETALSQCVRDPLPSPPDAGSLEDAQSEPDAAPSIPAVDAGTNAPADAGADPTSPPSTEEGSGCSAHRVGGPRWTSLLPLGILGGWLLRSGRRRAAPRCAKLV